MAEGRELAHFGYYTVIYALASEASTSSEMEMLMRSIILLVLALVADVEATPEIGRAQKPAARPNILLIVGDDIGFGDLGISGSITRTPNLVRLAEEGVTLTNFHASPVCSVTRGMLLTGNDSIDIGLRAFDYALYPPAKGKPGYESYLTRTTVTVAELLQDAGYRTYMVGKWHLGGAEHGGQGPHEWGFDRSYAIYTGGSNHWNQGVFHVNVDDPEVAAQVKAGIIPKEPFYEDGQEVERPIGIYSDDLYTSKMLEYLEQGRKSGQPFFAYLAYTTAHAPLQAPDFLIDKYVEHYLELGYEGLKRARFESQKVHGIIPKDAPYPSTADNDLLRPWSELSDGERRREARMMATYSAMMESQDYHIGILLNYLHETGQRDDTLVIYMSDNGPEGLSDHGELSSPEIRQMDRAELQSGRCRHRPWQCVCLHRHRLGLRLHGRPAMVEVVHRRGGRPCSDHHQSAQRTVLSRTERKRPTRWRASKMCR